MYDPMTVAHEIRYPWKNKSGYRNSIITIWHVDPEKNTLGTRSDDSCGWFSPPYTQDEKDAIIKLAKQQYREMFPKNIAYSEGKSYAYICYNQDCYGAIYWAWRAMRHHKFKKVAWQYETALSVKEMNYVMQLATNPVDNFQHHFKDKMTEEKFVEFFMLVWWSFGSFHRPWYKHPRWHINHWRVQFHPWQQFKRRWIDKCSKCGKRGFTGSAYSDWDGSKIWCEKCNDTAVKINTPTNH
mgnify:CR=1 FL=1